MPHTPGPWMAAARASSIVGLPVVAPQSLGRSICNVTVGHDETESNACLIAAAPDLLAALIDMVDDGDATDRKKALKAIAKARGET